MKFLSFIRTKKLYIMVAVLIAVIVSLYVFKTDESKALGIFGFGGYVASVTVCTCSPLPSYYVSLGPPTGGELILTGTSEPYAYYDIWGTTGSFVTQDTWVNTPSGPWVMGTYVPGGQCLMLGEPCYPMLPVTGTITQYGTSLGSATTGS